MSQTTKQTRPVLTIAVREAASGGARKLGKKKAARLTKALKKVAKAADEVGLEVTSDLDVLTATGPKVTGTPKGGGRSTHRSAAPKAGPPPAGEPGAAGPAVSRTAVTGPAPVKRAAAAQLPGGRRSGGPTASASPKPPARRGGGRPAAATASTTSAEPATVSGGNSTGAPAAPRRALRRTPARPPVPPQV